MITAFIFAAALASAQDAAPPAPAPVAAPTAPAAGPVSDSNKVICHNEETTGSRLGAMRVCMTKAQWEERSAQDKASFNSVLNSTNATAPH